MGCITKTTKINKTKRQFFEKPDSLDALFYDVHENKESAILLLDKEKLSRNKETLSEEDKSIIARSIYQSTFYKVFQLNYHHKFSGKSRNSSIGVPMENTCILEHETSDYFKDILEKSKDPDDKVYIARLSRPAFWFAKDHIWDGPLEGLYDIKDNIKNDPVNEIKRLLTEYSSKFKRYETYMVTNINNLLSAGKTG